MAKALKFACDGGVVDVPAFPKTAAEKERFTGVPLKACDLMTFETADGDASVIVTMYFPETPASGALPNVHDANVKGDFVVGASVEFVQIDGGVVFGDRDYDLLFARDQLLKMVAEHARMMAETNAFLQSCCASFPNVDVEAKRKMDAVVNSFNACDYVDRDDLFAKAYATC